MKKETSQVELYIDFGNRDENKSVFDQLLKQREQIEANSPITLVWQRLDERRASRIKSVLQGGYRSPKEEWPRIQEEMVKKMTELQSTLQPLLQNVVNG